jgi:hypothetical protein
MSVAWSIGLKKSASLLRPWLAEGWALQFCAEVS